MRLTCTRREGLLFDAALFGVAASFSVADFFDLRVAKIIAKVKADLLAFPSAQYFILHDPKVDSSFPALCFEHIVESAFQITFLFEDAAPNRKVKAGIASVIKKYFSGWRVVKPRQPDVPLVQVQVLVDVTFEPQLLGIEFALRQLSRKGILKTT